MMNMITSTAMNITFDCIIVHFAPFVLHVNFRS